MKRDLCYGYNLKTAETELWSAMQWALLKDALSAVHEGTGTEPTLEHRSKATDGLAFKWIINK